jgi:type VI secretion system protein ImpG
MGEREELLRAYWRELGYLRRMGTAFAETYPKVAGRLELSSDISPDPHVERLIESFAFLTARIQHNLDSEFPEIAVELLNILHPHYLNPVPSMAIARFDVDPERGKITSGFTVPKHAPLFALASPEPEGPVCRFRTCYPVTLWPVAVTYADFESTAQYDFLDTAANVGTVLRLRLEPRAGSLADLELSRLRFYLNGDRMLVHTLYELLFCQARGVVLLPDPEKTGRRPRPVRLPPSVLRPVGFGRDEEVLPYPPFSQPGYRLLQEYFTFPEKLLFVDLEGLSAHGAAQALDILILLDRSPKDRLPIDRDTFALGCTPIINLFPRTTEPIRLDHRRTEYPLVPDARRERFTEIHSIQAVSGSSDPRNRTRIYEPFYSFNHHMAGRGHQAFWHARRQVSLRKDVPGSEMLLSLVDLDFKPYLPPSETVYAHTLCTNRRLAEQLLTGALFQTDLAVPAARIVCLTRPTQQLDPPSDGSTLWRLISHLSLNYLSFSNDEDSLKALREILKLYSFSEHAPVQHQIQGIRNLALKKVVQRTGSEAWRGFCRGTEVTLTFDESAYVGGGAFLLASVLDRFFALYASINSFTQLVIRSQQREGEWKRWPAMAGEQMVL